MRNPLWVLLREQGGSICSVCSASDIVLRAALRQGKRLHAPVLIEATANQVNQFGGYTGMQPVDFLRHVYDLADEEGFDADRLILGGDHLGPLTWSGEPEADAMEKAETLIGLFVEAGYLKIHIDTSMRLKDDDTNAPLPVETVARRSARLAAAAEAAYSRRAEVCPDAPKPVYVIGSEVPIPGGAQEDGETVTVTSPDDFRKMMDTFRRVYHEAGLDEAFSRIVAAVVQPGVEFSDDTVTEYCPEKAQSLVAALKDYPGLAFEGHSTDYQTRECLRDMVRDGIRILKVGPALTFGAREGLFALEQIEREVCGGELSNFRQTLEETMRRDGKYWKKYYHGSEREINVKLAFSYSDRSRYYMGRDKVRQSQEKLFANVNAAKPPLSVVNQYMPIQCARLRRNELIMDAQTLCADRVRDYLDDYSYACGQLD